MKKFTFVITLLIAMCIITKAQYRALFFDEVLIYKKTTPGTLKNILEQKGWIIDSNYYEKESKLNIIQLSRDNQQYILRLYYNYDTHDISYSCPVDHEFYSNVKNYLKFHEFTKDGDKWDGDNHYLVYSWYNKRSFDYLIVMITKKYDSNKQLLGYDFTLIGDL